MFGTRQFMFGTRKLMFRARKFMFRARQSMFGTRKLMFRTRQLVFRTRKLMFRTRKFMFRTRQFVFRNWNEKNHRRIYLLNPILFFDGGTLIQLPGDVSLLIQSANPLEYECQTKQLVLPKLLTLVLLLLMQVLAMSVELKSCCSK